MTCGERSRTKRAVLFDIDGTLLNSWDFIFGAVKHTLATHKYQYPSADRVKEALGRPLIEFYQVLSPGSDPLLLAKTHHEFQQNKLDLIKLFPSTKKTLKALKNQGFLLAAVSNRSRDSLLHSLKHTKILDYFTIVVSAEDVENPKPHPDHLLFALKHLQVTPAHSYIVGDTDNDILAGKNAKVKTIGVTYGSLGTEIKNYDPDFIIDDISQLLKLLK